MDHSAKQVDVQAKLEALLKDTQTEAQAYEMQKLEEQNATIRDQLIKQTNESYQKTALLRNQLTRLRDKLRAVVDKYEITDAIDYEEEAPNGSRDFCQEQSEREQTRQLNQKDERIAEITNQMEQMVKEQGSRIMAFEELIKEMKAELLSKQEEVAQLKMELNLMEQERTRHDKGTATLKTEMEA